VDSVVCTDGSEVRQYGSILTIAQNCWICQYGSILTIAQNCWICQYGSILTIAQNCWICQYGSILTITLTTVNCTSIHTASFKCLYFDVYICLMSSQHKRHHDDVPVNVGGRQSLYQASYVRHGALYTVAKCTAAHLSLC